MIKNIIRLFLTYLSFYKRNDFNLVKEDTDIITFIIDKLKKKKSNKNNLKNTHQIFNRKMINFLNKKKLKRFLKEGFIQQMFFVHNRFYILNELLDLRKDPNWKFYKYLCLEDNIGDPVRYYLYPSSSGNRINHVYHLNILSKETKIKLDKIKYVFEFGGGYGCMARIFSKINSKIKYKIFDMQSVSFLQYYYLKQIGLNVGFKNLNNICLINNLNKIKNVKFKKGSLFIANWSLSESPIKFRKKFLNLIKKHEIILICFQEYFENINNLKYFIDLKKELSNNYKLKILENKYYKGNILKKQKHFFMIGKKIIT